MGTIVRNKMGFHDPSLCGCVRCKGFQPGHKLSPGGKVVHGAYELPLKLMPEAEKMAERVRPHMPVYAPAFEATLQSYCILLVRIERAHKALEEWEKKHAELSDDEKVEAKRPYLHEDLRRWTSSALKHATQLGLTPASAAAILRDTTGGHRDLFRPPSQQELERVPLDSLRRLQSALNEALADADVIDA